MQDFFKITPRVIAHLGEDLIKNESIAVLELVKNSYDAYASKCEVYFEEKNGKVVSIQICDNGHGMNAETIKDVWLVIGTDNKKKILQQEGIMRYPLGEKGIGRLGVHKLGKEITLISKTASDPEVELTIDWKQLESAKSIDNFPVGINTNLFPLHFAENETGTKIIITSLKSEWDRRQLREIYRNIMSLHSPFEDASDQFEVIIRSNNEKLFAGLPTFEDIISNGGLYFGSCIMSGDAIKNFKYEFKPWSTLNKISSGRIITENNLNSYDIPLVGYKEIEGKRKPYPYNIDLNTLKIGDIRFDIIIFEMDSIIFNYVNSEKTSIKDYLKENGGIRVYRDNVRVYDYGERDNDWLGIDLKRVHRVGGNISNNIVLGSVRLDRKSSVGLKEKTNREGFVENKAYHLFKDAILHVINIVETLRFEDKSRIRAIYGPTSKSEPVLQVIGDLKKFVDDKIKETPIKTRINKYLLKIEEDYKLVCDNLLKAAGAGLNMSVIVHEVEKIIAEVSLVLKSEKASTRAINLVEHLSSLIDGYADIIRKSDRKTENIVHVIDNALFNTEYRLKAHDIEVERQYKNFSGTKKVKISRSLFVGAIMNIIDNSIYWLEQSKCEHKKFYVGITEDDKFLNIIFADNGVGFLLPTDTVTEPFVSAKPDGIGLGLHIANEILVAQKGTLKFPEFDDVSIPLDYKNGAIIVFCLKK